MLRLLLTCPLPVHPGVGHFSTFSCMARTIEDEEEKEGKSAPKYTSNLTVLALVQNSKSGVQHLHVFNILWIYLFDQS